MYVHDLVLYEICIQYICIIWRTSLESTMEITKLNCQKFILKLQLIFTEKCRSGKLLLTKMFTTSITIISFQRTGNFHEKLHVKLLPL